MEGVSIWLQEVSRATSAMAGDFIEYLPTLVGAILVLVAGWLIARLVRSGGTRIAYWANGVLETRLGRRRARHLRLSETAVKLLGNVLFWLIILFFVTSATRILGLVVFSAWLDRVVVYLPTLLSGGLIIVVGVVVSSLARDLTAATITSAGVGYPDLFARGVQLAILVTALVLGINQVGIDVSLLVTLIVILVGAVVGSMALAFALGANDLVRNLIGSHYLQRHYRQGQRARLGGVEGEIVELTAVSVVLSTEGGRAVVPARVFSDETTLMLAEGGGNE